LKKENKNYNPLENNTNVLPNVSPKPDEKKADKTKDASDNKGSGDDSKKSKPDASNKKPGEKVGW